MDTGVYWAALESLDADLISAQFAAGGSFQLASASPLTGRAAIRRAFRDLFLELESIERNPVSFWAWSGLTVCDADLTLNFNDGIRLSLSAITVLWTRGGEIVKCRVVMDLEPRLARYFTAEDFYRCTSGFGARLSAVQEVPAGFCGLREGEIAGVSGVSGCIA